MAEKPASRGFELPARYAQDLLVLLVRDPWWLFAYWEVTPEREKTVADAMRREGLLPEKRVLRMFEGSSFFDIEIGDSADNWYVEVGKPDSEWQAEIGWRTAGGRFFALVKSNRVRTPRASISDVLDEEWLMPDDLYWKLFLSWKDRESSKSSLSVREILERYLRHGESSETRLKSPASSVPTA